MMEEEEEEWLESEDDVEEEGEPGVEGRLDTEAVDGDLPAQLIRLCLAGVAGGSKLLLLSLPGMMVLALLPISIKLDREPLPAAFFFSLACLSLLPNAMPAMWGEENVRLAGRDSTNASPGGRVSWLFEGEGGCEDK